MTDGTKLDDLKVGDVIDYWHDAGIDVTLHYGRITRITRCFIYWEHEHRERIVKMSKDRAWGFFNARVKPHEWSPWNPEGK